MTTIQLPSTTHQSSEVTHAWRKLFLETITNHPQTQTTPSLNLPPSQHLHLVDTHQLWQSLEILNKSLLPTTKRALARLQPRLPSNRSQSSPRRHLGGSGEYPVGDLSPTADQPTDHASDPEQIPTHKISKRGRLIAQLEDRAIAPKPWTLRGEITASARPTNSLLQTPLLHDTTRRAALADDHDARIDDMIKQRIADTQFDDVVLTQRPLQDTQRADEGVLADLSEKPTKGLAEVYEEEFRGLQKGVDGLDKGLQDVYQAFWSVSRKLDGLCDIGVPVGRDGVGEVVEAVPEDLVLDQPLVNTLGRADHPSRERVTGKRTRGSRVGSKRRRL